MEWAAIPFSRLTGQLTLIKDCGDRAEGEVRTVVMLVFSLKILV